MDRAILNLAAVALEEAWGVGAHRVVVCSTVLRGDCVSVGELDGLWAAGLHPELVCRLHAMMEVDHPLSAGFYLAAVAHLPDLIWVRETAAAFAERRLHTWLAETETALDRERPSVRLAWLRAGVLLEHVALLSYCGYGVEQAAEMSAHTADGLPLAVWTISSWAGAGLRPSVDELLALRAHGLEASLRISSNELHRADAILRERRLQIDRTSFALIACVSGNVNGAVDWAAAGFRGLIDVLRVIAAQAARPLPAGLTGPTESLVRWCRERGLSLRPNTAACSDGRSPASVHRYLSQTFGHEMPEDWWQANLARARAVMADDLP